MSTAPTANHQPNPSLMDIARAYLANNAPDVAAVRNWSRRILANGADSVPAFGTAAWVALPDADPRKLVAALAPALARLIENTPAAVALRLRRELLAEDRAVANRLKAASLALSTAQSSATAARRPTHAELERRRAQYGTTTAGRDAA